MKCSTLVFLHWELFNWSLPIHSPASLRVPVHDPPFPPSLPASPWPVSIRKKPWPHMPISCDMIKVVRWQLFLTMEMIEPPILLCYVMLCWVRQPHAHAYYVWARQQHTQQNVQVLRPFHDIKVEACRFNDFFIWKNCVQSYTFFGDYYICVCTILSSKIMPYMY